MKIILSLNKQVDPGWIKPVDDKTFKLTHIDVGELDELILDEILERYPLKELKNVIGFYGQKVKKGGIIKLMGPDLLRWSNEVVKYRASHADFSLSFFRGFQCALSVNEILDNIPPGFRVLNWDYQGNNYSISLERQ